MIGFLRWLWWHGSGAAAPAEPIMLPEIRATWQTATTAYASAQSSGTIDATAQTTSLARVEWGT